MTEQPKCADCKERPKIIEDGSFYCGAVSDRVHDDNNCCEYWEEGK